MRELTEELKLQYQNFDHEQLNDAFINACKNSDLEIVHYLLTSPELQDHAYIHAYDDSGFRWACQNGCFEVIRYLLASPELKEHADIHAREDYGFQLACRNGYLDVVRYLLTSPELKEHADIHADKNLGFQWACDYGHLKIVCYLLTFSNIHYIDFQKTDYNLDWAVSEKNDDVVKAMMKSLYRNDMIEYLENIQKIEQYCEENNLDFKAWQKEMINHDVDINSHTTELFL